MKNLLCHRNIIIRFIGLYLIGLFIFIPAWILSFYLFPEGLMRITSLASKLACSEISVSVGKELTRIFIVNLLMSTVLILFNLSFSVNNIPLGYLIPPIWFLLYGLILDSNSFTFAMADRVAPSLSVWTRSDFMNWQPTP
jgi:hypothetical protein